jgi:hypothetical protein
MVITGVMVRRFLTASCFLLGFPVANFGQQSATSLQSQQASPPTDKKDPNKTDQKKEPEPLFGGKLGIKSSSNTKETAAMGFNGIDPSGKVDAKMLATTPSAEHEAKAKQLVAMIPSPSDLAAFLREGGLKSK